MEHIRLSERQDVVDFLKQEPVGVVAVQINKEGDLHTAPLHYWSSFNPLEFYFVTGKDSEKCALLKKEPAKAAMAVGTVKGVSLSVQMRGQMEIVDKKKYNKQAKAYYTKRQGLKDDLSKDTMVLLKFTPNWARFTDFSDGWKPIFIDLTS